MRFLLIGDVIGKPGRLAVRQLLPRIVGHLKPDIIVINGENIAGGMGITPVLARELLRLGADVITTGNHVWRKKEIIPFLQDEPKLLRPDNYPSPAPGQGTLLTSTASGIPYAVINLLGRVYMEPVNCPFRAMEHRLAELKRKTKCIFVDFHAEATSEKRALAWYFDGQITALLGTHTHVQTADGEVLPQGTAFITDVGMTGPFDSVIGMHKGASIDRFLSQRPQPFRVANGDIRLQGVIVDFDPSSGQAQAIETVSLSLEGSL